jgi:hypothetical protein
MTREIVNPSLGNFITSLRDVGYTFEIAVADILDNSISACAKNISIYAAHQPDVVFAILDDGIGLDEEGVREAMRLASKNPAEKRSADDLGRFGLGLKTASFSQCRNLTLVSKKDGRLVARQWDLDLLTERNEWLLVTPETEELERLPLFRILRSLETGTLVVWRKVDRYEGDSFVTEIDKLKKHLSLVFHRFLEGRNRIKISVNQDDLKPFNPFNPDNNATQIGTESRAKLFGSDVKIQSFILPHHSKISQQEFERFATEEGYTKSQGFYLYRANRLLIWGTWWGLLKAIDSYKLVRIAVDIGNDQDQLWGIDIKKSTAKPAPEIRKLLATAVAQAKEKGWKVYKQRGTKISTTTAIKFWDLVVSSRGTKFSLNKENPLYDALRNAIDDTELLDAYLAGIEQYIPLDAILVHLQENPYQIKQESMVSDEELRNIIEKLRESGASDDFIESVLDTELFKDRKGLFDNAG